MIVHSTYLAYNVSLVIRGSYKVDIHCNCLSEAIPTAERHTNKERNSLENMWNSTHIENGIAPRTCGTAHRQRAEQPLEHVEQHTDRERNILQNMWSSGIVIFPAAKLGTARPSVCDIGSSEPCVGRCGIVHRQRMEAHYRICRITINDATLFFWFSLQTHTNNSNCLLFKYAVTAVCLCSAVSMPVLDGRRESCSSKTNSNNCLLFK